MKKRILKNLDECDPNLVLTQIDLIVSPIFELQQEYYNTLLKYKEMAYRSGYAQGERLVDRRIKEIVKSNKSDEKSKLFGTIPKAERKLETETFRASEKTLSRVDSSISNIIADHYKEGTGSRPLGQAIQKRFNSLEGYESERIARTEMHSAHELGKQDLYRDRNVSYVEWSTHVDNRTRSQHIDINGEIKHIDGVFSNDLQYPGDKNGIPSEVINCRCTTMPFIMPLGKIAPPGMANFRESDLVDVPKQDNYLVNSKVRDNPAKTIANYDKFKLTNEESYKLRKLNELDKLKFKDKTILKFLKNKQEFNELHNKFLVNGKLSAEDAKIYLDIQNKIKSKINLDKLYSENELLNKKFINLFIKKPPKPLNKFEKNLKKLESIDSYKVKGKKFFNFTETSNGKVADQVVLQNFNDEEKYILNKWSSDWEHYLKAWCIKENNPNYLREFFKPNISYAECDKRGTQLMRLINDLPKEKALQEDTVLWRGIARADERLNLDKFKIGKVNKFDGFTSTSYDVGVAESFAEYAANNEDTGYIFKIFAPKGTKGAAIDGAEIGTAGSEKEYLLNKGQKYITLHIDEKLRIIELLLVN